MEIYRRVTRIERDNTPIRAADAVFFHCGHMQSFAPGLGPRKGDERRCYACESNAKRRLSTAK